MTTTADEKHDMFDVLTRFEEELRQIRYAASCPSLLGKAGTHEEQALDYFGARLAEHHDELHDVFNTLWDMHVARRVGVSA
jgi:hypothetical protein